MFTQVYFISQCTHVWLCWSMVGNTGGWFTLTNTRQRSASFLTSLQLCLISHVRDVWSLTETTDLLTHNHTKCLIMLAPFKGPSAVLSIEWSLHYMVTAFTEHISLAIITLSCWFSCWVVKCRTVCKVYIPTVYVHMYMQVFQFLCILCLMLNTEMLRYLFREYYCWIYQVSTVGIYVLLTFYTVLQMFFFSLLWKYYSYERDTTSPNFCIAYFI